MPYSIEKKILLTVLFLGTGCFLFFPSPAGFSLLLGGGLVLGNYWMLRRGVEAWVARAEGKGSSPFSFLFLLKYPLFLGAIGYAVLKLPIRLEAFMAGISSLFIAVVWEGLFPSGKAAQV
ncbi:MAG: ATP synthase subunit I [bacterium]